MAVMGMGYVRGLLSGWGKGVLTNPVASLQRDTAGGSSLTGAVPEVDVATVGGRVRWYGVPLSVLLTFGRPLFLCCLIRF